MYILNPEGANAQTKPHACNTLRLAQAVERDLNNRFGDTFLTTEAAGCGIDFGGMVWLKGLLFRLTLRDGNQITLQDVHLGIATSRIMEGIKEGKLREVDGIPYVKIHGHWACTCLTLQACYEVMHLIAKATEWLDLKMEELDRAPNSDDMDQAETEVADGVEVILFQDQAKKRKLP